MAEPSEQGHRRTNGSRRDEDRPAGAAFACAGDLRGALPGLGLTLDRRTLLAAVLAVALPSRRGLAADAAGRRKIAVIVRPGQRANLSGAGELPYWHAWWEELRRLGYVEGENLTVDVHAVEPEQIEALAGELARSPPDVIFAPAQNLVALLKEASVPVPIVAIPIDPVGSGLAASLARPGGNITGFTLDASAETMVNRVAFLKEVSPGASRIAILILRPYWEDRWGTAWREATAAMGVMAIGAPFESQAGEAEFRRAFAGIVAARADALYVTPALDTLTHRQLIADLALAAGLPSQSQFREYVAVGGLMSYGPDIVDIFRRAAGYVHKILKGADPAEMPFQQPTKFDLAINMKTAQALGLTIPPTMLALADELVE